jgi:hypothetical protein
MQSNQEKKDTALPAVSDVSRSSVKDISARMYTGKAVATQLQPTAVDTHDLWHQC